MKNIKIIALLAILILLVGAVVFGHSLFSKKKAISIQNSVANIQQSTDNLQNTTDDTQRMEDSGQQAVSNEQETENEGSKSQAINTQGNQASTNKNQTTTNNEQKATNSKIINQLVSFGFAKVDSRTIDTIVVHSNYNTLSDDPYSIDGSIKQFKMYGVAAHYLIGRDGKIYKLVDEKNVAYHAGVSKMKDGRSDVNNFSIGIELMIKDSEDSPTEAQYKSLNWLISDIKTRWKIKYVVGHKDIAPDRKTDPWGFDWSKVQK